METRQFAVHKKEKLALLLIVKVECISFCAKKIQRQVTRRKKSSTLTRGCFKVFVTKNFAQGDVRINFDRKIKRKPFNFFVENVVRGNSVQIAPNFPAKSLSIYLEKL